MGSFCLDQEDHLQGGGIQKEPKVQHNNVHVPPRTWDGPLKGRAWLREARDSWATGRRESEDGRDQCPAHRLWGARGAGCGDGAAGGSSLRSQPQYPDHLLFLQDPGAADSLPPAGAELGSCGQWDQPERPHCSHIQPSPALALRLRWLPGSRLPGLCDSVGQHLQQCSYRLGALSSLLHPCPPSLPKWCLQSMPSTMPWAMKWSAGGSGSASHRRRARRTEPSEPTILD
uniref:Retinal G protein coupled receptor n=1 Tax=Papio anubis TaxID=9555 RepID=A0A8I5NA00_PAPAN